MRKYIPLLLPASGALTALCIVFPALGFLEWLSLVPAFYAMYVLASDPTVRLRRLYLYGLAFHSPFYLVTWHWLFRLYPMSFLGVEPSEAVGLLLLCWLGLSLLQSLVASLLFPLFSWLCRMPLVGRHMLLPPFLLSALFVVFEWLETQFWFGVPWGRLALGQINYTLLTGSAALLGSYLLSFTIAAVNALAALALLRLSRVRLLAVLSAAIFSVHALLGAGVCLFTDPEEGTPIVVAAVQGNIGSAEKWDAAGEKNSFDVYREYTRLAAEQGAQLVVFPETFIPYQITEDSVLGQYVSELAVTHGVTIRCGAFYTDEEGRRYNSVFTVFPDGSISKDVYCKQRLVPFGEFVPMRSLVELLLPSLTKLSMLNDDLAAGKSSVPIEIGEGRVGTLICFDSIYELLTVRAVREGAELITLSTNDSWFLDSAGVYMHHAQARLRAIESGRYIVRSADTGISSLIAPDGTVREEQPPLVEGMALGTVYLRESRTLYSYVGNIFVYLLMAAVAALPLYSLFEKKRGAQK